jgi:hypothetical protein
VLNWCERKTLLAGWEPASRTRPISNVLSIFRHTMQACLFGCYICFHTYIKSVLSRCYIVCNDFQVVLSVFANVSDVCFKCFICIFYMLQMLHLNVSKEYRVLHIGCAWEVARVVPHGARCSAARPRVVV